MIIHASYSKNSEHLSEVAVKNYDVHNPSNDLSDDLSDVLSDVLSSKNYPPVTISGSDFFRLIYL